MRSYLFSLFTALLFSVISVHAQDTINNIIIKPCSDIDVFAGSESYTMSYSELFTPIDSLATLSVSVSQSDSGLLTVSQNLEREFLTFSFNADSIGTSQITLSAMSGTDTASKSFLVSVLDWDDALAVYVQDQAPSGAGITSQSFTDLGGIVYSADDFVVPPGKTWGITKVSALGSKNSDDLGDVIVTIFQ